MADSIDSVAARFDAPTRDNTTQDDKTLPGPVTPGSLAERLRELIATGQDQVSSSVVAGFVLLLVLGLWWFTRPPSFSSPPVEAGLAMAQPLPTPTSEPVVMTIHVAGAVRSPGVFTVLAEMRVIDAIELAGGLASTADLAQVNLAGTVADGERLWIPEIGSTEPAVIAGTTVGEDDGGGTGPINLNTASVEALENLPGVGPATAAAIVSYRELSGPFGSVDQLLEVSGIGPAKLESIRPHAVV